MLKFALLAAALYLAPAFLLFGAGVWAARLRLGWGGAVIAIGAALLGLCALQPIVYMSIDGSGLESDAFRNAVVTLSMIVSAMAYLGQLCLGVGLLGVLARLRHP